MQNKGFVLGILNPENVSYHPKLVTIASWRVDPHVAVGTFTPRAFSYRGDFDADLGICLRFYL